MACKKHDFIGHGNGVTCKLCGLNLTHEEYKAYLKEKDAPKPSKKKKGD